MARQFNLIPPVCEQAEYHLFQREKVEVQLPELYHKIGKLNDRTPPPRDSDGFSSSFLSLKMKRIHVLLQRSVPPYFSILTHFDALPCDRGRSDDVVAVGVWRHHREV